MEALKARMQNLNKVAGLSCQIVARGEYQYSLVVLEKKKKNISVVSSTIGKGSLESVLKDVPKSIPISINISGPGIIHKQLAETSDNIGAILKYVLPNAKADEFELQVVPVADNKSIYTLVRKEILSKQIEEILELGYSVIGVQLGPLVFASLVPFIDDIKAEYQIGKETLSISNGVITEIGVKDGVLESDISIGDETILSELVMPYATAFQNFLGVGNTVGIVSDEVDKYQSEYFQKRAFKVMGWSGLIFILVVLLANFFINDSLKRERAVLDENKQVNQGVLEELNDLKLEVETKKAFLNKAGWLSASKASLYVDEIAASTPKAVSLLKMVYHPLDEKATREERKNIYSNNLIFVKGKCKSATILNPWLKLLKKKEWTKSVDIEHINRDSKTKELTFEFRITL